MPINQMLLPEFDMEMAKTRETLDRIPEDKLGWKPHEKSMTLGKLVTHIADMVSWATVTVDAESFDVAPVGKPPYEGPKIDSRKTLLEVFDKNVKNARAALERATDENLGKQWSLLNGGKPIFTMPRVVVLRSMVFNHIIHHRAQLGVYLRLNNVAVPGAYGPSADEMSAQAAG